LATDRKSTASAVTSKVKENSEKSSYEKTRTEEPIIAIAYFLHEYLGLTPREEAAFLRGLPALKFFFLPP
jgi:hypothetical protein